MGCFDNINLNKPIKCPNCKTKLGNEFQTKDLENLFYIYTEGTKSGISISFGKERIPLVHPTYTTIYAYDICNKCSSMVGQNFRFDTKGLLKRHGKPTVE